MTQARPQRVAIVGGGITGLAAAYRLTRAAQAMGRPLELTVLEAGGRLGGVIHTWRRDGFVIERGADSFITNKPWALELCHELGLQEHLVPTDARYRRSFVVRSGKLLEVPDGFLLLAPARVWPVLMSPIFSWRGKLRMGLDLALPRRRADTEESLADFVTRRLGREALERLVQPLVANIYTADPAELSLLATMPQFVEMERKHRSLIRAARRRSRSQPDEGHASGARFGLFMTLDSGLQTIVEEIVKRLPEGAVRTNATVTGIKPVQATAEGGGPRVEGTNGGPVESPSARRSPPSAVWRVSLRGGETLEADGIILALPARCSASLIGGFDRELATELGGIGYASTAIVLLGYRRKDVGHPLNGFGFVVPAVEDRRLLGCSFPSIKFPNRAPEGEVVFRAFIGGALQPELVGRKDGDLTDLAHRELAELLGISGAPTLRVVQRQLDAMPQYHVGHLRRVDAIEQRAARWPGLELAGNAYRGVGIPDCIHSAQQAVERLLAEAGISF